MSVRRYQWLVVVIMFIVFIGCGETPVRPDINYMIRWNKLMIETMKTDGISPVLATRMFCYPNIAAYDVLARTGADLPALEGKLHDMPVQPEPPANIDPTLASVTAYYAVMKKMNYREDLVDAQYKKDQETLHIGLNEEVIKSSEEYGQAVGKSIFSWCEKDGYGQTKGLPHYIEQNDPGTWKPTPPEFRSALEPHWGSLRTFVIDSIEALMKPPVTFDTVPGSEFYGLAMEVYNINKNLTEEQKNIALFWDDNPDLNNFQGHIGKPRRHINPAAHWMNIVAQLTERRGSDHVETTKLFTLAAISFYDANLVCWYTKYKYSLLRPVSYIRRYIDPEWMPLLVTPPFPEHTSGHSTCGAAGATMLEHFLGENYAFVDSTHYKVGLGVRNFNSIMDAAVEASMSRLYGGIHYMTAAKKGKEQGKAIGKMIIHKLEDDI